MKKLASTILILISIQYLIAQECNRELKTGGNLGENIDYSVYFTPTDNSGNGYWDVVFRNCNSNYNITLKFDPVYTNCFNGIIRKEKRNEYTLWPGVNEYSDKFNKPKSGHSTICFNMQNVKIEKEVINPKKKNRILPYFGPLE